MSGDSYTFGMWQSVDSYFVIAQCVSLSGIYRKRIFECFSLREG